MKNHRIIQIARCFLLVIAIMTIFTLPLHATTHFYVDPDFGGSSDGSASNPWTSLTSGAWTTINTALASDDVTVYFSAREAGSDTDETTTSGILISRTNCATHHATGCNRLTLDGMSQYNTNDSAPSWSAYGGDSRFHIKAGSPVTTGQQTYRNFVTIRGFELESTNSQGIYYWGGDNVYIEYNEVYHSGSPNNGPGIYFEYVNKNDNSPPCDIGPGTNCGCSDIYIQYNTIHNTRGECLYTGGCYNDMLDCSQFADIYHDNVNINYNTIYDCATFGGEPDGINPHGHHRNLTVKGNTVYNTTERGRDGIEAENAGVIENNFVYNYGRAGITLSEFWDEAAGFRDGTIVRNNIIVNCGYGAYSGTWKGGIHFNYASGSDDYTNSQVYNNTIIDSDSYGIYLEGNASSNFDVRNNVVSNAASLEFYAASNSLQNHDYNLYYDNSGTVYQYGATTRDCASLTSSESNSICSDPLVVDTSTPYVDTNFYLQSSSPARDEGTSLSSFSDDYFGISRPQGAVWDVGAAEYRASLLPPSNYHFVKALR